MVQGDVLLESKESNDPYEDKKVSGQSMQNLYDGHHKHLDVPHVKLLSYFSQQVS